MYTFGEEIVSICALSCRVVVENVGESAYIAGEQVERSVMLDMNDALRADGKLDRKSVV